MTFIILSIVLLSGFIAIFGMNEIYNLNNHLHKIRDDNWAPANGVMEIRIGINAQNRRSSQ
jgi:hypothetical protein